MSALRSLSQRCARGLPQTDEAPRANLRHAVERAFFVRGTRQGGAAVGVVLPCHSPHVGGSSRDRGGRDEIRASNQTPHQRLGRLLRHASPASPEREAKPVATISARQVHRSTGRCRMGHERGPTEEPYGPTHRQRRGPRPDRFGCVRPVGRAIHPRARKPHTRPDGEGELRRVRHEQGRLRELRSIAVQNGQVIDDSRRASAARR